MSEFRIKNIDTGSILWRGTGIVYPVVSPEFSISLNKIALVFQILKIQENFYLSMEMKSLSLK